MAKNKAHSDFIVTDRRLFTAEGELRKDASPEETAAPPVNPVAEEASGLAPEPAAAPPAAAPASPPPPSQEEQQAQAEAYQRSSRELDARLQQELSGHKPQDLEMTFERFLASLYMSALLQLGLLQEQGGQPRLDLIGARQTIDTLGILHEKTKGNLTSAEQSFLQNCLYELRMAYLEVTNALAHPPQAAGPDAASHSK